MEVLFDKPVWSWKLLPPGSETFRIHDPTTKIVKPGGLDPEVVAEVQLEPPSDVFGFIRDRGYLEVFSHCSILIKGKRAYLTLYVNQGEYPLFYWTRSNAPYWLKRYLT